MRKYGKVRIKKPWDKWRPLPRYRFISPDRYKNLIRIRRKFWRLVEDGPYCWIWKGTVSHGYGQYDITTHVTVRAHRYAWEQFFGEIPPRTYVRHECGNRLCVNPAHLYLGGNSRNGSNFWSLVEDGPDCWTWKGKVSHLGYGLFSVNGVDVYAHRHAWELVHDSFLNHAHLRRSCSNRLCVNPAHLLVVQKQKEKSMARRRSLSLEAIHQSLNTECPHCHHLITPAERHHRDTEHLRCAKCQKDFVPRGAEKPMRTS
jgi:hypothetical protein